MDNLKQKQSRDAEAEALEKLGLLKDINIELENVFKDTAHSI